MSNPNPYGQPGQNFGGPSQPNQPNQAFPAQQPNQMQQPQQPQQFGPQNQFNPQGPKGQSLQWNQMGAIAAGVSALLVLIVSFFPWVGLTAKADGDKVTLGVNGWGQISTSGAISTEDIPSDFGNGGLGALFMILVLGLLIGAAVMLWLKAQPRIAVFMAIGSGALLLIWGIVTFVQFNGPFKDLKDDLAEMQKSAAEYGVALGTKASLDGGPKFWLFVAILLALAIITLGVIAIVKYGHLLQGPGNNNPNQFGQPQGQPQNQQGQPGNQFGQPQGQPQNQPGNQFGQPQGQPQNQPGQPGNQNPFNQPGQ